MKKTRKCKVCGHEWESRKVVGEPYRCPNQLCQSPHWEKGRGGKGGK